MKTTAPQCGVFCCTKHSNNCFLLAQLFIALTKINCYGRIIRSTKKTRFMALDCIGFINYCGSSLFPCV
jgi:hypothetical protein